AEHGSTQNKTAPPADHGSTRGNAAPTHGGTTTPPAEGTPAPSTHGEAPPSDGGKAPLSGGEAPPSTDGKAAPTHGSTTTPPADGNAAPTHGGTTTPPAEGNAAPTHGETPPPADGTTAPPTHGDATPAIDTAGAIAFVRDYYSALDERRYADAWAVLSPAVRQRFGGFARWKAGYARTTRSDPRNLTTRPDGTALIVSLRLVAHEKNCDATQTFRVTWRLEQNAGGWRVAGLQGIALGGRPCE
ncbi:MAG TPA: hypothetical protein VI300_06630, partial [Solirubrobacter sp.]